MDYGRLGLVLGPCTHRRTTLKFSLICCLSYIFGKARIRSLVEQMGHVRAKRRLSKEDDEIVHGYSGQE